MSSKKQRRREEKAAREQRATARGKVNPAWLFIAGIALVIVLTLGGVMLLGDRSGPGEPPWPGAVWSPAHGHWH